MFRWEIVVLERNAYGDRVVRRIPMSVLAENKSAVTDKVRAAFGAKYDDFRHSWSHGWELVSVSEPGPFLEGVTDGKQ